MLSDTDINVRWSDNAAFAYLAIPPCMLGRTDMFALVVLGVNHPRQLHTNSHSRP